MEYIPAIHTKCFLLNNASVAFEMAEKSAAFAKSDLAFDIDIIRMTNSIATPLAHILATYHSEWMTDYTANSDVILSISDGVGETVAHRFATHQPAWLREHGSTSQAILMLSNKWGITVAHHLAMSQSEWVYSAAAKTIEILKIADKNGWSVAHELARSQPKWLLSDEMKMREILTLKSKPLTGDDGNTVAEIAIFNYRESFNHPHLTHKETLTIPCKDGLLADVFIKRYADLDASILVFKLIEQGAAYKSAKPISLKVGESLLRKCILIMEVSIEPLTTLKQLQAFYSTIAWTVEKSKIPIDAQTSSKWQVLLLKSEALIRQHLETYQTLFDIEHRTDIFCEPAENLFKKLLSERVFNSNVAMLNDVYATSDSQSDHQFIY
jgi:hypothetical protein